MFLFKLVWRKTLSKVTNFLFISIKINKRSVIPRFDFMIITVIVIINIELRYYMYVHNKMGIDNFVGLP